MKMKKKKAKEIRRTDKNYKYRVDAWPFLTGL